MTGAAGSQASVWWLIGVMINLGMVLSLVGMHSAFSRLKADAGVAKSHVLSRLSTGLRQQLDMMVSPSFIDSAARTEIAAALGQMAPELRCWLAFQVTRDNPTTDTVDIISIIEGNPEAVHLSRADAARLGLY